MADDQPFELEAPALSALAASIVAEFVSPANLEKLRTHAQNVNIESIKDTNEAAWGAVGWMSSLLAKVVLTALNAPEPLYNALAKAGTDTLLGEGIRHSSMPADSGRRLIAKLEGTEQAMTPGIDGAANYLTLMLNEQMEAWVRGVVVELVSEYAPKIGGIGGGIETFAKLEEIVESALGGGRMIRRVLQPFVTATAITPSQWHVNKKYRPELLGVTDAVRHFLRGKWTRDQLGEELARQGWSEDRINALVSNSTKRLDVGDLLWLHYRGFIGEDEVLAGTRDLGYDDATARSLVTIERNKLAEQWNRSVVSPAVEAFVSRDIDESELRLAVDGALTVQAERAAVVAAAKTRRALKRHGLSASEARRLAKAKILTVADYRRALAREGYDDEAAFALELELRAELGEKSKPRDVDLARGDFEDLVLVGAKSFDDYTAFLADHGYDGAEANALTLLLQVKRDQQLASADEALQRAQEKAQRQAELDAKTARTFPSSAEFRRAVVRGLLPIDRYVAELARLKYADEDIAFLRADVENDRAEFLEAERRKAAADDRLRELDLSLAEIRELIVRQVMSLDEYRDLLIERGYDQGEAAQLVTLMRAELDDRAAADAKRTQREAELARRGLSLADVETAVRRGVRTIADYAAFLLAQGYGDVDRALLVDLLGAQLDADADARQRKADADAAGVAAGIPLATVERAVRRGVATLTDYRARMNELGLPLRDQNILVGLLQAQLDDDAAARARQPAPDTVPQPPGLTFGEIQRAVRVGILDVSAYRDALDVAGYAPADVDVLVALLVEQLGDTRVAQDRRTVVAGELAQRSISLGDYERSVRRGITTLAQYRGFLFDSGYGPADVELLAQLLEEEVGIDLGALRASVGATVAKSGAEWDVDVFEASVLSGERTGEDAVALLTAAGVKADQALVYVRLVMNLGTEG